MDKYSPWFPPEIKPVYVGQYECESCQGCSDSLHYFDGENWYSNDKKYQYSAAFSWRGLAKEPK